MLPYNEFMEKCFNSYFQNLEINYFYSKIYFNSFINTSKEFYNSSENYTLDKDYLRFLLKNMESEFDNQLKSDEFLNLLSKCINTNLDLINYLGNTPLVKLIHDNFDFYLRNVYSPLVSRSKESKLSNHNIIFQKDKIKLLHYMSEDPNEYEKKTDENILLIIYAPINRFHILDINSSKSVVRNLMNNNIDVYLLDWGYPDKNDDNLNLKNYIDYINDAVNVIIKSRKSGSSIYKPVKISILGYCWGGIFSLIYSAIHQTNINKLILMATPVDFNKDNTTVSLWCKNIDDQKFIDTFGHCDGYFLNFIFNMRNPGKFLFGKYFNLWKNIGKKEFVETFLDVENWLHDTPPIPGEIYKKIVDDCYKNNLLIKDSMSLENKKSLSKNIDKNNNFEMIEINKISIPILSLIAEKDTLVSPSSSLAINDYTQSRL